MNIATAKSLRMIKGLPPKAQRGDKISLDTEFFGQEKKKLHRPHGIFSFLGCSFDGETVYYITDESEIQEFMNRLEDGVWIFHNAKYDIRQLRRFANIPQRKNLWDTMLIEQIMFSGYYSEFALNDLVRRYCDTYMSKEVRKEFSKTPLKDILDSIERFDSNLPPIYEMTKEQIEYACVDVAYTWKVYKSQKEKISDSDLNIWRTIELPFLWTLLAMSGVKLDTKKWLALAKKNQETAKKIQDKYGHWEKQMVKRDAHLLFRDKNDEVGTLAPAYEKEKDVFVGINLNSPKQVKEYFLALGWEVSNTDVEILQGLADDCEFAKDMLTYRTYQKRSSTYGEKFVEDYVEADGKIYADIYQIGAECMPRGELVLTNRGYLNVEDVKVGDLVITHEGTSKSVIDTSVWSRRQIYKVTLFNGLSLRTTGNHPYLTKRGWVRADKLKVGDVVAYHSRPEQWKRIEGWEDFSISSWGRVVNNKTGHILTLQSIDKWGHLKVTLVRNGSRVRGEDRKDFRVHRLVAEAFVIGKDYINNEVRHLNGFSWDNTSENLCWGTSKENKQDAILHGTMSHRYTSSQSKVTDEMVAEIRNGENYRGRDNELSAKLGISRRHIWDIRNNVRWQDVPERAKKVEFKYTLVTDIHIVSNEVTYGLEVEDDHSHVTGGIVTHNTGRTSCRAPNLQNQPHEDAYRDCFIADDEETIVVADWGSQEPRFAAFLSEDDGLIDALNSEEKLYVRIAREALDIHITKSSPEYKHLKSTVLGLFYGMSAKGLAKRIGVDEISAQYMINSILETYPGVKEYMKRQKRAKDYVTSVYGRKIWLNKYSFQWERNALNAPIQSSAADAMKLASSRFMVQTESESGWELILLVHDEIAIKISHEGDVPEAKKVLENCMIGVAEEMHKGIRGAIDIYSGKSWACKG